MGMTYNDKDMFAFVLRHMPALKHLEFACHHWGPLGFDAAFCSQGLAQLKNLESIEMYEVYLCDSAAVHVAKAFAALPKLKRVDINMADRFDDDWTTRSDAKDAEPLTLKGYTAIFNAIRGRVEFLKLRLVLCDSGIGAAKQFEALASAGLKELSVSVDTFRASEEQEAQGREEFSAMLRHFCSCPSLGILTFDFSLVPPETILEVLAANPHLVKLEYDFFDQWTIDHYCKLLKIIYASKIVSFKQSGICPSTRSSGGASRASSSSLPTSRAGRATRATSRSTIDSRPTTSMRVWGSSRYLTVNVSSDETPNSRESLFEEDSKPRPAAAAAAPTRGAAAASAPAARSMPPGRGAAPPSASLARARATRLARACRRPRASALLAVACLAAIAWRCRRRRHVAQRRHRLRGAMPSRVQRRLHAPALRPVAVRSCRDRCRACAPPGARGRRDRQLEAQGQKVDQERDERARGGTWRASRASSATSGRW
jgi:hypothetical protein